MQRSHVNKSEKHFSIFAVSFIPLKFVKISPELSGRVERKNSAKSHIWLFYFSASTHPKPKSVNAPARIPLCLHCRREFFIHFMSSSYFVLKFMTEKNNTHTHTTYTTWRIENSGSEGKTDSNSI